MQHPPDPNPYLDISVTGHVDEATQVRVIELPETGFVSIQIGAKLPGVTIMGPLADVHRLIIEADTALNRLANDGGAR